MRPRVEELEGRSLPSVSVLPARIDLATLSDAQAVFTVQVVGDGNPATANLLSAGADCLSVDVLDAAGNDTSLDTPVATQTGNTSLSFTFSRSNLAGLAAGTYQVQVSDGDDADTETGVLTLFSGGQGQSHPTPTHPGHHPRHHHHHAGKHHGHR
jgi:hypothetical protein